MTSERHILEPPPTGARDLPESVLAATRASVLAVGVRRTTLSDVARRAGVSRMTLYRLVPDVTALVLEVMTREFAALLDEAERSVARRRSGRARLVAGTVEVVRRLPDAPLFRRVLDVDPELLLPFLTDRWGSTQQLAQLHLRRQLAEGLADGSIRKVDLDATASALLLTATGFVLSAHLVAEDRREALFRELAAGLDGWLRP